MILRDQNVVWVFGWVACLIAFISVFFPSWVFKAISTASRHLSIPSLSIELFSCFLSQSRHLSIARWINRETFYPVDSSLTATSIYRACFAVNTSRHLLDNWICRNCLILDTPWHLYLSRIIELLYIRSAWFGLHFARSFLIYLVSSPPEISISLSKPSTHVFFGLCVLSLLLVCLFFTHSSYITCFDLTFWVFVENLGFFKIFEFFTKFLGWFLWKCFKIFMHCISCAL